MLLIWSRCSCGLLWPLMHTHTIRTENIPNSTFQRMKRNERINIFALYELSIDVIDLNWFAMASIIAPSTPFICLSLIERTSVSLFFISFSTFSVHCFPAIREVNLMNNMQRNKTHYDNIVINIIFTA